MGKFAEAAAVPLAPKKCPAQRAVDELVKDDDDQAALDALVEKRKWSELSGLLGVTDNLTRYHFSDSKKRCSCG